MTGFYLKGEYINLSQYFFFHLSSEKKEHSEKEREKFLSLYLPPGVVKKKFRKFSEKSSKFNTIIFLWCILRPVDWWHIIWCQKVISLAAGVFLFCCALLCLSNTDPVNVCWAICTICHANVCPRKNGRQGGISMLKLHLKWNCWCQQQETVRTRKLSKKNSGKGQSLCSFSKQSSVSLHLQPKVGITHFTSFSFLKMQWMWKTKALYLSGLALGEDKLVWLN